MTTINAVRISQRATLDPKQSRIGVALHPSTLLQFPDRPL
jgi:hypothetical protein